MRLLKFRTWGVFSSPSLEPFREYELTADAPEWGLHKGDILYDQGPDEEPERFFVRPAEARQGPAKAKPEVWQVEAMFGGSIPEWTVTGPFLEHLREMGGEWQTLASLAKLVGDMEEEEGASDAPEYDVPKEAEDQRMVRARDALGQDAEGESEWWDRASVVAQDIPSVGLRNGDVVIYSGIGEQPEHTGPARGWWLSLDEYYALRELEDAQELERHLLPGGVERWTGWTYLKWFIHNKNRWGMRAKEWRSRLYVIRPVVESPTVIISAPSDLHALFELVTSCGGKFTNEGRA